MHAFASRPRHRYGQVVDAKIQPITAGFVYMKFADQAGATACVGALNNRWFAGKQISAAYVPEADFESI
jgi:RNA-binding protein 39